MSSVKFSEPKVKIAGKDYAVVSFEVMKDIDQPDFASVVLANTGSASVEFQEGSGSKSDGRSSDQADPGGTELIITVKNEGTHEVETVFEGQLTGIEPTFDIHLASTVTIRGMNKMHKFTRERRTRTYVNLTEEEIVKKVIEANGLVANFDSKPPTLKHEHLHQPNMTDLEFLQLRAARTNRECYVEKDTFYFRLRNMNEAPVAELRFGNENKDSPNNPAPGSSLESFTPQWSTTGQVEKVVVHGWDPDKKAAILSNSDEKESSKLGNEKGSKAYGDHPVLHIHNIPVRTLEEAKLIAQSLLEERQMNFITAEAVTEGDAKLKPGGVVKIKVASKRFDGLYYIAGAHFTFTADAPGVTGGGATGGFKTHLKLKRDAGQGKSA